jgi:DNA-directed RNA polymerase
MQTIAEYQTRREQELATTVSAIPEVRPFARRHVEQLQADGYSALVLRQLCREAESSRRIASEETLAQHATSLNLGVLQTGLDAFRTALETAKRTTRKVSKIEHKGGKFNPINAVPVEDQASATWDAVVAAAGRMVDADRPLSVQVLAGSLAGRLRNLTGGGGFKEGELGYERAALLLLDHFEAATGWIEEKQGELKIMSRVRKPNTYTLTAKFLSEVLGGGLAADFSERRPMLVPPVPWTPTATHGGYLHAGIQAVRGTNRPIGSPVISSALNALQGTAFRVNRKVLEVAGTFTRNAEELQGRMVLGRYIETRHDLSDRVQRSKTIRSALTLSAMGELENEEAFYFPWNLDWRGRFYPATSLISPQGADLCKGCLEFADGTPLGRHGGRALAIHLCNLAGAEKAVVEAGETYEYQTLTPDERAAWAYAHTAEIMAIAADPLANRAWHLAGGFGLRKIKRGRVVPVSVDKPWQFLAACFEWAAYQEEGDGFRSRLAGALDGSCSGVQMLAGMTRDKSAGAMVNLVPAPRGDDYYGRMARALSQRLYSCVDTADSREVEHLLYWAEQTLDRDLLKAPSMTKVYSAGAYTFGEQVQAKTGAPEAECMWLANRINECFADVAPGMLLAMGYLQAVSDVLTEEGIPLYWTTPAGLRVEQGRHTQKTVRIETRLNVTSPRKQRDFRIDGDTLSKKGQRAGVAPNFVHGVDASHMAMTVNDLHARGVRNFWMIHDSFGAPFAQFGEVFDSTREQFVALMSSDLLQRWTEDVTAMLSEKGKANLPPLPKYGDLDLNAVRESVYAWF